MSLDYMFMSQEDNRASQNPIISIKNEGTGELYARAVGQKGLGEDGSMDWLIKAEARSRRAGVTMGVKAVM